MGFFDIDSQAPLPTIPRCGACGLLKTCKSPKLPVWGNGGKRILIVSEAPGKEEDEAGNLMVGNASDELVRALKACKINMRQDCWLTNSIICYPGKKAASDDQVDHCRPNLIRVIKELDPVVIILLGSSACRSLLKYTWRGDIDALTRWVGWKIPNRDPNAWICPTYNPAFLLKSQDPVLFLMFKKHLAEACAKAESRPWTNIPDYREQIELVRSPDAAARIIRKMTEAGGLCAFDYEADRLKPDHPKSRIFSCSICWRGKRTIAYPWHGEAITATHEFLQSKNTHKVAANMKFEERWTKAILGCRVKNWAWDTVISAHHLDNRQGITSIKFQSYVRLGWPLYDIHIEKYFENESGSAYGQNNIRKLALDSLLQYNGLDSLLEFIVAKQQMAEAGFQLHKG